MIDYYKKVFKTLGFNLKNIKFISKNIKNFLSKSLKIIFSFIFTFVCLLFPIFGPYALYKFYNYVENYKTGLELSITIFCLQSFLIFFVGSLILILELIGT